MNFEQTYEALWVNPDENMAEIIVSRKEDGTPTTSVVPLETLGNVHFIQSRTIRNIIEFAVTTA